MMCQAEADIKLTDLKESLGRHEMKEGGDLKMRD